MAEISAKDVAALRKETGAGMMDCKKALEESGGDLEAAKTWLREKGLSGAAKRSGREAGDGAVEVLVEGGVGAVVELNCETDFVAKGDDFGGFLMRLAGHVLEHGTDNLGAQTFDGETVDDAVKGLAAKLGEHVTLGRVERIESAGVIDGYRHVQNERGVIGVLVELTGVEAGDARAAEVAHDLALHVASAAPRWLSRDDVPEDVVAAEREVFENLTRNQGKPEQAIPKIVEGRVNGFFKEHVLLDQGFVREPKKSISTLIGELGESAALARFVRVQVGAE